MLPAVLRRRLDRVHNLQLSFLAAERDRVQIDATPLSEVDFVFSSSLLRNAGFEAQQSNSDTRLVRSLFINGLGYLLDALPSDLTVDEARAIYDHLPESVRVSVENSAGATTSQRNLASSNSPSYLHRLIATFIVYIFVFVQVILPYLRKLLNLIYRYERKYRLTEKVLATALNTADGANGKGAHNVGLFLSISNQGKIMTAVGDLIAWLSESVAGGIYEGVNEGLVAVGVAHSPNGELEQRRPS
ncbi:hypothetical protein UA08_08665 [Talaromyces atroroseus]|uniref:Uncharacterized protein n=1 Tax=Talaromyces atroroseus TaxID=1441469 RepID=A0A225A6F7_TALAT|nr:hypothetical protein UA08_08665 [Talaromyces atroroseus]OKL56101.1 hypothetical protein UA08_08665 [Talaromyces atroroseus]